MAPPSSSNEKLYGITQIKAYIPILLDMANLYYNLWRELFETHCVSFGVLGHLDGSTKSTPEIAKEWKERDGHVKMWIYGTISESIIDTVLKKNSTARELWLAIETLFLDNKEARALQLENELRTMVIGDLSVHDYCKKMKNLADLLANIDFPVTDRALVMHMLNGLSDKFDSIINVIKHKSPFLSFLETRSMLQLEEDRLSKQIKPSDVHHDTSSSSTILYTISDGSQRPSGQKYNSGRGNRGRNRGGGRNRGRGRYNNNWSYNQFSSPWTYNNQWQHPPFYAPMQPPQQHTGYPTFGQGPFQPTNAAHPGILGPHPSQPTHAAHMANVYPYPTPSAPMSQLPPGLIHAFNTMTLQEPDPNWYMDSAATSHITSNIGSQNPEQTPPM
ncbi:uncharacterized protein LOC110228946 isoform X2 [Arabidopsis lyrata subsp. lyrata]|uniref:uncharacterized protein LOC110228946 isoform X2 n=1 Tax=Arabidopsis lyrata subsp. lyrata TaxID=81972 RepID=UPI000A29E98A|nr:uncharacterized protein LOC110228946 isoform X2 [Arabidopsis lyrata subsp. lyrata]|eukprot:XP_020883040.1 uncharacterized protein LOC110228946 isoform X2 [Arabidopsis lyrata subsp. lyrata]